MLHTQWWVRVRGRVGDLTAVLPGDADVSNLLPAGVVDQRQAEVLQRHLHFLLKLLELLCLSRLCYHGNVLREQQHPLPSIQEGDPVDLRQAIVGELTHLILKQRAEIQSECGVPQGSTLGPFTLSGLAEAASIQFQ